MTTTLIGYELQTDGNGAIDVNVVIDTSVSKTGGQSVKFTGNPTGTYLCMRQVVIKPCAPADILRVTAWAYAAEKTGDDNARLYIDWYDQDDVYVSTTWILAAVELSAAAAWIHLSNNVAAPAGAYGWRVGFGKDCAAENIWWDSVIVEAVQPSFHAYLSTEHQVLPTGSLDYVDFNVTRFNDGGCFDTGTHLFTAPAPGLWVFQTSGRVETSIGDQLLVEVDIQNTTSGLLIAQAQRKTSGTEYFLGAATGITLLAAGDVVRVAMEHFAGADRNLVHTGETWFAGYRL